MGDYEHAESLEARQAHDADLLECLIQTRQLTYTATIIVALAAHHAGRPDLIRSPKRVLAHTWQGL